MIKAVLFGYMAAIVGAYKGLNAGGGPSGVGRAVNESVIIAFMLLFALNSIITAIYFQVVPQNGLVSMATSAEHRLGSSAASSALKLEERGDQLLFYVKALAWTPRAIRRYRREILNTLAEVAFGVGGLSVIAGTVGRDRVHGVLRRHRGRHPGLRVAQPDRRREVHRVHLGLLQHPRGGAAGLRRSRWRPPWAAATPHGSARCGSPRRSTRSR